MKKVGSIAVLSLVAAISAALADENLKAFPEAEPGMVRHVLQLPKQNDETAFKVELIAGKTVKVDGVNQYWFGGQIKEETIEGWGFPRYVVSKLGPMAGTLMAIDPAAPKQNRFVTLGREPYLIRYNSRLPVVVYAPEGVEIRYRVWTARPEVNVINKG